MLGVVGVGCVVCAVGVTGALSLLSLSLMKGVTTCEVSASVASAFLSRSRMLARGLRGASRLSVLRTAPLAPRALAARGLAGKIVDGENICPR